MLNRFKARWGKVWHMWFFFEDILFICDARHFESLLSSQELIKKDVIYDVLRYWLGDGLLLSTGGKWRARRKVITPTFHFKILEQFVEIFDQQSIVMVEKLKARADGKTAVDIFPVVGLAALDIISESAMGVKIDAQRNPRFPYAKALTDAADIIATRVMKPHQSYDLTFYLSAPRKALKLRKCIKIMHSFTDNVIEERRRTLERTIADGSYKAINLEMNDIGAKQRMAFLDVLLQSTVHGKPLSNSDIREEVDTFMFEGHDTTTSGISFTCYLIARHPAVQCKLFQEILDVLGKDKDRRVTMRELHALKYLECVIKEGLRLYPPVPIIGRITTREAMINGQIVPANCNLSVLIYAALRDPNYFVNPDDFVPERFDVESCAEIDPFAYVPFSAGPRNCIGQKFALLEMKSAISKLLRHYELLPLGESVRPIMNLVMRSATGVNVGLRPRVY
ncbi:PREDICTED: probable cytochrome P450 4d14 isoform X2 [Rhagoletis zephyria]|nr:PREDICTED: probable cytochrome P450 4d14 isoform X2 [Rhagoletis zephyria]XP_036339073.1 probable cytochrome P450 4d14 isoform X2 [Rhagoletis pomonella]